MENKPTEWEFSLREEGWKRWSFDLPYDDFLQKTYHYSEHTEFKIVQSAFDMYSYQITGIALVAPKVYKELVPDG